MNAIDLINDRINVTQLKQSLLMLTVSFFHFSMIKISFYHLFYHSIINVFIFYFNVLFNFSNFSVLDKGAVHAIAAKWTLLAEKIMEKRSEYFNAHQDLNIPGLNILVILNNFFLLNTII